jgi:threonyl-tRNA synthetase
MADDPAPSDGKEGANAEPNEVDHRRLGRELDLFTFHEEAPGQAFFHDKGVTVRNILINLVREENRKRGFLEVITPQMLKRSLWEQSGHWNKYAENMIVVTMENEEYAIKPMNCPGAILIYRTKTRSYRDMPIRLAEFGLDHRNELSGALSGLFRARAFVQDDAHLFVREDQIEGEITSIMEAISNLYGHFNFDYRCQLSTKPEVHIGGDDLWLKAEKILANVLQKSGIAWETKAGEGSFYGPKVDFHVTDSLGRSWQLGTIQLDFNLPERFQLAYVGEDGKDHVPVLIHRALLGTLERFMAVILEHYNGELPTWLAPVQAAVVPVSEKNFSYSSEVVARLLGAGVRTELYASSNTMEYRVREARGQKIPYIIVVGKKEEASDTVAVRTRDNKVRYGVPVNEFAAIVNNARPSKESEQANPNRTTPA